MFNRVIVERLYGFLFGQIVRVGGLGRAERVLQFGQRAAEEAAQLRLDLFGVFRLFDRGLHFVERFRRALLERVHELCHFALSRFLQTVQSLLLLLLLRVCRAATLNNQNKPHTRLFSVYVFQFNFRKKKNIRTLKFRTHIIFWPEFDS